MPITGSQKALMECRSGVERCGASRTGYYTATMIATINSVDRTSSVIQDSLNVHLGINAEGNTARFRLKPDSTIPSAGETVYLSLGQTANRIFGGQVARPKHIRREGNLGSPFADIECVDWRVLFDRRLVNQTWTNTRASDIALDIMATYTSGFATTRIQSGLPNITTFVCENEPPSSAFTRLVTLMGGGGWYIDPDRVVHLFDITGETNESAPFTLANTLASLKAFAHEYDNRQIRNRVIAEGRRTSCPILISAGSTHFPVVDPTYFLDTAGLVADGLRVGTDRITYTARYRSSPAVYLTVGLNGGATTVYEAASAGATSIKLNYGTNIGFGLPGWLEVDGQYFSYTTTDATGGGTNLFIYVLGIPATGYGALPISLEVGNKCTLVDSVLGVPASGAGAFVHDQPKDSDVIIFAQADDATAQTALAAIEGGDGIHEYVVSNPSLDIDGMNALAEAELDAFAAETGLPKIDWTTTDLNAKPGVSQIVNFTTTDAFAATLTITSVDLSFPKQRYPPFRRCQASDVKRPQLVDVLADTIG